MKVYSVTERFESAPEVQVIGVYSTIDKAKEASEKRAQSSYYEDESVDYGFKWHRPTSVNPFEQWGETTYRGRNNGDYYIIQESELDK